MSLTSTFTTVALSGALMLSGAILAEPIVLALGHLNSGGVAFMNAASPWLNMGFDSIGITDGLHSLAEMIPPAPGGADLVAGGMDLSTNAIPPADTIQSALAANDF